MAHTTILHWHGKFSPNTSEQDTSLQFFLWWMRYLDENWPYLQVVARLIFKIFMSGTFNCGQIAGYFDSLLSVSLVCGRGDVGQKVAGNQRSSPPPPHPHSPLFLPLHLFIAKLIIFLRFNQINTIKFVWRNLSVLAKSTSILSLSKCMWYSVRFFIFFWHSKIFYWLKW